MSQLFQKYGTPISVLLVGVIVSLSYIFVNRYDFVTVTQSGFHAYELRKDRWTGQQCAMSGMEHMVYGHGIRFCDN